MRYEDEVKQVALVADQLVARYPSVPRATVEAVVRDVHAGYVDSPVRDFVPLLVERGAREQLRAGAESPEARLVG